MSTQEIQDYKLNWLRKNCFRVVVKKQETKGEHLEWLRSNLNEKFWDFSFNKNTLTYTFFFESHIEATRFREEFQKDSRTVDINS